MYVEGALWANGFETPFRVSEPMDAHIEDELAAFNADRQRRGEAPVIYVKRSDGTRLLRQGQLPLGAVPQLTRNDHLRFEAEELERRQAAGWPKPAGGDG